MERHELEGLSREGLIALAEKVGVARPRVLTQPELIDEIIGKTARTPQEKARARGWLGRARDLVARVIEKGLHLPDAARALGGVPSKRWPDPPPPLPTVTLAEIYAAQGHFERALSVLDEVLAKEPEHRDAGALRERLREQAARARAQQANATVESPAEGASAPTAEAAPASGSEEEASDDATAPLPSRYEVDEVVGIAVDPRTLYLYWEVRPTTLAHARARRPDGHLAIRVMSVLPSWDGPLTRTRDLPVDALHGDIYVHDVDPGSNVRVSVGWIADGFQPFAVGIEVAAPKEHPLEPTDADSIPIARWRRTQAAPLAAIAGPSVGALPTTPTWRAALDRAQLDVASPKAPARSAPSVSFVTGAIVFQEPGQIVERTRIRRAIRGGASELAWEDVEMTRVQGIPRGGARGLGRGGASELARGGASELGRR